MSTATVKAPPVITRILGLAGAKRDWTVFKLLMLQEWGVWHV